MSENTTTTAAVSADDVRNWATKRGIAVKAKGQLASAVIDAYNKAHKAQYVKTWVQPARVLTLAGRRADTRGINRPVKVRATAQEVRTWANSNGHKVSAQGRIPTSVLTAFANRNAAVKA